ncbi:MAG: helix-turn-helix domain-containing protein [Actinomycetota bacterium]|nr:helix-turn-helix domain-containing protein [Actinomycetota bacterium]MDQ5807179.1 helix-turn-helix domain-containing protein [Actinomycetota bacterium]
MRQRIFVAAVHEDVSAKELAARFEQPIARTSYHVRTLADAGLLRVVRRTPRRGATETHYRAISTLEVSEEVIERAGPEFRAMWHEAAVRNIAEDARHAFGTEFAGDAADAMITRAHFVATEEGRRRLFEEVLAFYRRLGELEEELWEESRASDEPPQEVALTLMLYPGTLRGERNRAFVLARGVETLDLDTIPSFEAERDDPPPG